MNGRGIDMEMQRNEDKSVVDVYAEYGSRFRIGKD